MFVGPFGLIIFGFTSIHWSFSSLFIFAEEGYDRIQWVMAPKSYSCSVTCKKACTVSFCSKRQVYPNNRGELSLILDEPGGVIDYKNKTKLNICMNMDTNFKNCPFRGDYCPNFSPYFEDNVCFVYEKAAIPERSYGTDASCTAIPAPFSHLQRLCPCENFICQPIMVPTPTAISILSPTINPLIVNLVAPSQVPIVVPTSESPVISPTEPGTSTSFPLTPPTLGPSFRSSYSPTVKYTPNSLLTEPPNFVSNGIPVAPSLPYTAPPFQWCVDDTMSVRVSGSVIQFGGAEPSQVVHTKRSDCDGVSQGWKDVVVIDLSAFAPFVVHYAVVGGENICSTSLMGCSCDYRYPVDPTPTICSRCKFGCNGAQKPFVSITVQSAVAVASPTPTFSLPPVAPSGSFSYLGGLCLDSFSHTSLNDYVYQTCFFEHVTQYSQLPDGSRRRVALVGNFGVQLDSNSFEVRDGDMCFGSARRKGKVFLNCGLSHGAVTVESPTCFYTLNYTSPEYCITSPTESAPTRVSTVVATSTPVSSPSFLPTGTPIPYPTIQSSLLVSMPNIIMPDKICQNSGYCLKNDDCVVGNKCIFLDKNFSQCQPDSSSYLWFRCVKNYDRPCDENTKCCDPGAFCDHKIFRQCIQPVAPFCATPMHFPVIPSPPTASPSLIVHPPPIGYLKLKLVLHILCFAFVSLFVYGCFCMCFQIQGRHPLTGPVKIPDNIITKEDAITLIRNSVEAVPGFNLNLVNLEELTASIVNNVDYFQPVLHQEQIEDYHFLLILQHSLHYNTFFQTIVLNQGVVVEYFLQESCAGHWFTVFRVKCSVVNGQMVNEPTDRFLYFRMELFAKPLKKFNIAEREIIQHRNGYSASSFDLYTFPLIKMFETYPSTKPFQPIDRGGLTLLHVGLVFFFDMGHLFKPFGVFSNNCQTYQRYNLQRSLVSVDGSSEPLEISSLILHHEEGYGSVLQPGASVQEGLRLQQDGRTNLDKCCTWCLWNLERHPLIGYILGLTVILILIISCSSV